MLSLKNQTEGNLAEPDADFVSVVGFLILEEGETAAAINITILEVKFLFPLLLFLTWITSQNVETDGIFLYL